MGGVPKQHHSKSKARRRRSHQALKPVSLLPCPNCNAPKLPHRACKNCGVYNKSQDADGK